ncbi:MAG: hypothetical protein JGK21_30320 [Microcoleus sp. PH2017_22_RUC_O_B]|uniref:hypothetical protein n=1 Tax=unclassified Microcoleus TaxID=2642155 RepID=UPI001D8943CA|nr:MULTISPECIES: hypothetical protein [unclassified Microcoleus]MCC3532258.1 hypothetical protein [Microcoleus sp. PH2017_21_RUC_O_A]MCC3544545.1 hypothetical protein [Microcoleus sp. PH2017_22_RUC_O_B]
MTAKPKKPGTGKGKGGKPSPSQQKAGFKEELASRIESEHESVQFDAGITVDKIEQSLGVGNLKIYFQEVENNFANSRTPAKDATNKSKEAKTSPIKIKKISSSRPKKRRKQRGKIK